jgi:hypothetical protein
MCLTVRHDDIAAEPTPDHHTRWMTSMRFSRILLCLATAAVATLPATACTDSNAPDRTGLGSYALVSVNGAPLPLTVIDQPTLKISVQDGALVLAANKSYTQTLGVLIVTDGVAAPIEHLSCTGSYARSGNTFTLTSMESDACSGVTATGTLDGNTLTVTDDQGEILVFRR